MLVRTFTDDKFQFISIYLSFLCFIFVEILHYFANFLNFSPQFSSLMAAFRVAIRSGKDVDANFGSCKACMTVSKSVIDNVNLPIS